MEEAGCHASMTGNRACGGCTAAQRSSNLQSSSYHTKQCATIRPADLNVLAAAARLHAAAQDAAPHINVHRGGVHISQAQRRLEGLRHNAGGRSGKAARLQMGARSREPGKLAATEPLFHERPAGQPVPVANATASRQRLTVISSGSRPVSGASPAGIAASTNVP